MKRTWGWIRVLQVDVFVCTALATVTTLGYFLIGAAVFYGTDQQIGGDEIVDSCQVCTPTPTGPGQRVSRGALCTLLSTLIVGTAAFARMWRDMFVSLGWLSVGDHRASRACIRGVQMVYLTAFLAITIFAGNSPEQLVIFGQYVSGLFGTPMLMIVICWLAFRTDKRVRMGGFTAVLLVFSVLVLVACVVGAILIQFIGKT
ncbi:MAG: hypothetical protein R3B91_01990 [Planctomycetaceae bacterium]